MAEFEELRLTVNLVDNASTGLRNLNTQIALVGSNVDKSLKPVLDNMTKQMKLLAVETREANKAVSDIRKDLEQFAGAAIKIGQEAGLIGPIGAIGGLIGVIGGINLALGVFAEKMLALRASSVTAGLLPDQFMNIARQLRQIIPSAVDADAAVIKFMRNIREVTRAGTPEFQKLREFAGADSNLMLRFAQGLSQQINRGDVEGAFENAALLINRKFNDELAKSGRQEATRQAEAMAENLGMSLDTAQQIARRGLNRFGDEREWAKRIKLGEEFKIQLEKSNEAWEDMIFGMQQKLLPLMIELNRYAMEMGEAWGGGIGKEIRKTIDDIKGIKRELEYVWLLVKAMVLPKGAATPGQEADPGKTGGPHGLPTLDWLKNLFISPAGAATMPGGPGMAFPGTGGPGPGTRTPGVATPPMGTPSLGGPPVAPTGPPAPVPYNPAPTGPGGIPGVQQAPGAVPYSPVRPPPSGSSVGPGVGPGAGQTPPSASGGFGPMPPGGFGPSTGGFTPYGPGQAPMQAPPAVPAGSAPRGRRWHRLGPSGSDVGPGSGPGAGQTPAGIPQGQFDERFRGAPIPGGDSFDERFRGSPLPNGSSVGPGTGPGAGETPGGTTSAGPPGTEAMPDRRAWPRTLPGNGVGQAIGTAQPSPGFGLPAVGADYVPKVLGGGATPAAPPAATSAPQGGGTGTLGDLNIQDISGQSARVQRGMGGVLKDPKAIVTHFTAGSNLSSAVSALNDAGYGYNYMVDKDGTIYQFTPTGRTGAHIRTGWGDRGSGLSNSNTIGIAAIGGSEKSMTPAQIQSMKNLTATLGAQHGISPQNVFGHGEVNPGHRGLDEGSTIYKWARGLEGGWPAGGGGQPTQQAAAPAAAGGGGWPTKAPTTPWPSGQSGFLQQHRARLLAEINSDPIKHERFMRLVQAESGSQGAAAREAFAQTTIDRWAARGETLDEGIKSSYYGGHPRGKDPTEETRAHFPAIMQGLAAGEARFPGSTGNASANVLARHYAAGRVAGTAGGEGFINEERDRAFRQQLGEAGKNAGQGRPIQGLTGRESTSMPIPDTGLPAWMSSVGIDRSVIDSSMGNEAGGKVEGKGTLGVTVTDKRGEGTEGGNTNLYQHVPMERMIQHEPAKQGPSKPESTPDPIDLPEVEVKGGDRGDGE